MSKQKQSGRPSERLFPDDQSDLFEESHAEKLQAEKNKPVECLGLTFPNDDERRKYFLEKLQEKLKDPELRKIEGFPIGSDEDILALSDPPYYTACPNPFLGEFLKHHGKTYDQSQSYNKEPFAADSQFGKTSNAITRAHPYHTKVPPEAVQTFIQHYFADKSGVFLDCFCGIGMSGIGLNFYKEQKCEEVAAVLCDLSTIGSFVTYNYNSKVDSEELKNVLNMIAIELEERIKDLYSTRHVGWQTQGKQPDVFDQTNNEYNNESGTIEYLLLSEEIACPNCGAPNLLWRKDIIDIDKGQVKDRFPCVNCGSVNTKKDFTRIWEAHPDPCINDGVWRVFRQKPVLIYYTYKDNTYCKYPDAKDVAIFRDNWNLKCLNIPISRIPNGDKTRELIAGNSFFFHHCYYPITLKALDELNSIISEYKNHKLYRRIKFAVSPLYSSLTRMAVIHVSNFFRFLTQIGA